MTRIELYEKYEVDGNSQEWWDENMPAGAIRPESEYAYRRTMPMVDQIERPIEIPGNKKEFIVQFWGGEQLICLGDYDQFCLNLHDIEELMLIEQDERIYQLTSNIQE